MHQTLPILIYRLGAAALTPLAPAFLAWRGHRGKEDGARAAERLAAELPARPPGPLIWCHAVSVGEMQSIRPVLASLPPGVTVLLTTSTTTASRLAPDGVIHRYAPLDLPAVARRFLNHWRPDLLLWTESEFWPNLLAEVAGRRIPALLLQGRISVRSHRRWQRIPRSARQVLSAFDLVLAQSAADAGRLRELGAVTVRMLGNLKGAAPILPADPMEVEAFRTLIGSRPCWIAASTHPGEDAAIVETHRRLLARYPALLTLIAPRHPEWAAEIVELCAGLETTRAALGQDPNGAIHIVDRMGVLGLWYRLAQVAFLGGSLVPVGGHNPFEPAQLSLPLLHGPNVWNFADAFAGFHAAGAAISVAGAGELAEGLGGLLDDPGHRHHMGMAARTEAARGTAVLGAVREAIDPWIRRLSA